MNRGRNREQIFSDMVLSKTEYVRKNSTGIQEITIKKRINFLIVGCVSRTKTHHHPSSIPGEYRLLTIHSIAYGA